MRAEETSDGYEARNDPYTYRIDGDTVTIYRDGSRIGRETQPGTVPVLRATGAAVAGAVVAEPVPWVEPSCFRAVLDSVAPRLRKPRYVFRGPARGPLASGPGMTVSPCRRHDLGGGVTGPGRCRRRR
jgi:hypothetical protein